MVCFAPSLWYADNTSVGKLSPPWLHAVTLKLYNTFGSNVISYELPLTFTPLSKPLVPVAIYILYDVGFAVGSKGSFTPFHFKRTLSFETYSILKLSGANG